jgi:hypothetical protein
MSHLIALVFASGLRTVSLVQDSLVIDGPVQPAVHKRFDTVLPTGDRPVGAVAVGGVV